jgi:hypothetical protein
MPSRAIVPRVWRDSIVVMKKSGMSRVVMLISEIVHNFMSQSLHVLAVPLKCNHNGSESEKFLVKSWTQWRRISSA